MNEALERWRRYKGLFDNLGPDPLARLAAIVNQREYPNLRQVPFRYHTKEHGPVFAYKAMGDRAECLTWLDATVQVKHNDLLPFDPLAEGAELISDLEWDVMEAASPHPYKSLAPRKSKIGAYIFEMPHLWNDIVRSV